MNRLLSLIQRLHIHYYHSVSELVPAHSMPEPTNPFELERRFRRCRCGKEKPPW